MKKNPAFLLASLGVLWYNDNVTNANIRTITMNTIIELMTSNNAIALPFQVIGLCWVSLAALLAFRTLLTR